jgi:hypothetical protein
MCGMPRKTRLKSLGLVLSYEQKNNKFPPHFFGGGLVMDDQVKY